MKHILLQFKGRLAFIATLNIAGAIFQSSEPWFLRQLLDSGIPSRKTAYWSSLVLLIGMVYALRVILFSFASWRGFCVGQEITLRLRSVLFEKIISLRHEWHDRTPAGEMRIFLEEDIADVTTFVTDIQSILIRMIVSIGTAVVIMRLMNATLMWAILLFVVIFVVVNFLFRRHLNRNAIEVRDISGVVGGFIVERLAAIPYFKFLNLESQLKTATMLKWKELLRAQRSYRAKEINLSVVINVLFMLATVVTLHIATGKVLAGIMTAGELVAFYAYLQRIFEPLSSTYDLASRAGKVRVGYRRLNALMATRGEQSSPSPRMENSIANPSRVIEMSELSFSFEDRLILDGASLVIERGQRVALIGESGCGKTTLARILVGALPPRAGRVSFRGQDIIAYSPEQLRASIVYVPQHAVVLSGSLNDNLCLGESRQSLERFHAIASICSLKKIRPLADDLGPFSAISGTTLSGGERQRIALARALLRNPEVLILDEATSALDEEAEAEIMERLIDEFPLEALIVISHRSSLMQQCDRLLKISDGKLHELRASRMGNALLGLGDRGTLSSMRRTGARH